MKRTLLSATVLGALALASTGWAQNQPPAKAAPPVAANHRATPPATNDGPAAKGGMSHGMMGSGMGMGGGMCSMMTGPDMQLAVKNTEKGVTLTFTSTDPTKVTRLQKMAEAMRLMHETNSP